jgi:hypothetical protein
MDPTISWARVVTIALGGRSKEDHITDNSKLDEKDANKKAEWAEWRASDLSVMS